MKDEGRIKISRGSLRGRPVIFPGVADLRPTPSRVREAVFSMLQPLVETHAFVDLFSGSGAMLFEAWSCGFRPVYGAESHPSAQACLNRNARALDVVIHLLANDAMSLATHLTTGEGSDEAGLLNKPAVFYADPPYRNLEIMSTVFAILAGNQVLPSGSVVLLEHEKGSCLPEHPGFTLQKKKKFGRTILSLFGLS